MKLLIELFTGKLFEFYSPHTLNDIYTELEPQDKSARSFIYVEEQTFKTQINRYNKTFQVQDSFLNAIGTLHEEPSGTRVTGKVYLGGCLWLFLLIIYFIMMMITGLVAQERTIDPTSNIGLILPITLLVFTLCFVLLFQYKQFQLDMKIHNKLGKSKRKNVIYKT